MPSRKGSDSDGEDELELNDVLALGGDEDDFKLLKSTTVGASQDQSSSLVEQLEVKKMLKELGLTGDGSSLLVIKDDEVEEEMEKKEEQVESSKSAKKEVKSAKSSKEEEVKSTKSAKKEDSKNAKSAKKEDAKNAKSSKEEEVKSTKSAKKEDAKSSKSAKKEDAKNAKSSKTKQEDGQASGKAVKESSKPAAPEKTAVSSKPATSPSKKTAAASKPTSAQSEKSSAPSKPVATAPVEIPPLSKLVPDKPLVGYLVKPSSMWLEINGVSGSISSTKNDPRLVDVYRRAARQIYEMEVEKYMKAKSADTSGDAKWIRTVMKTGTLSDRVAALALQIQESPVHQLSTLSNLLMMANKKVKREALIAVDTLKELFMVNLLPENRKLRSIGERPFDQLSGSDKKQMYRQLLLWHVEDEVKKSYGSMMNALDSLLKDPQFEIRKKVLAIVQQLLAERPEQEQALLKLLSNKLGDPERRLASTASHYLLLLVNRHPNMRLVIVNEIERFMYRPNLADRARYYAVCFLNQQILSRKDKDLANKLISVYFSFYSKCSSGKDSELDSKMLSALLVGVNRAFPFAELKDEELDVHVNTLYSTVHKSTFNASVQALMLLFQIMQSRQSLSDRFYCALYSKLMDHRLVASSKQSVFMNLLYKAIKADPRISRVKAFIKRVLQVCNMMPPSFVCGALFMISQLCTDQPAIRTIIDQPEDTEEEEHFKDVQLDDDEDDENDNSEDADDEQDESAHAAKDSDAEATTEDFGDVDDAVKKLAKAAGSVKPSKGFADRGQQEHYVALHRNPLYCGAEHSCSWEIRQFAVHYHPSVRTFAEQVVAGVTITYKGDPLQDFTLVRFLDRFVFRNPKKRVRDHGGSVMQRKETSHLMTELPVNHTSFWSKNEDKIRPDEVFYHRYFRQLNQLHPHKLKSKPGNDTEDVADEGPEGDEESMDFASDIKTTVKSNKREQSQKGGKRKKERQDSDDDEGAPVSGRGGRHGAADEDSSDDDSDEDLGEGEGSDDDEDIDSGDDFDELLGGNADDEDMGGGDFDEELGEEFNYSDLDDMSDEDMSDGDDADQAQKGSKSGKAPEQQKKKKKKKFTDADYEKALFENLSSDEDGTASSASAAGLSDDMSKMFMGAEEFAAMLKKKKSSKHGSASQLIAKDGVSQKQLDWEEKRINAGQNYRQRKRQFRRGR